jgi:hypothetical protein
MGQQSTSVPARIRYHLREAPCRSNFVEPLDFWMRPTTERKAEWGLANGCYCKTARTQGSATQAEADTLKQLALFAGAGLLVSVLMMTYGLDLSPGFF